MKFNTKTFRLFNDQFNYYNLIKKINPHYRLYFDQKNKKFAIVNIYNNFEICLTFASFYNNIIQDLRFSKTENTTKILNHIEEINNKIMQKRDEYNNAIIKSSLKEFHQICNRSTNINKHDINKIIGASKC